MPKRIEERLSLKDFVETKKFFKTITVRGKEQTRVKDGIIALIDTYRIYGFGGSAAPKHLAVIINKDAVNPHTLPFKKDSVVLVEYFEKAKKKEESKVKKNEHESAPTKD